MTASPNKVQQSASRISSFLFSGDDLAMLQVEELDLAGLESIVGRCGASGPMGLVCSESWWPYILSLSHLRCFPAKGMGQRGYALERPLNSTFNPSRHQQLSNTLKPHLFLKHCIYNRDVGATCIAHELGAFNVTAVLPLGVQVVVGHLCL